MIICIYWRRPRGKSECLEIVGGVRLRPSGTPVMALHRGRLDLLQEHLDRDPSLLDRRFTFGEVFAVKSKGVRAMPPPRRPCPAFALLTWHSWSTTSTWRAG